MQFDFYKFEQAERQTPVESEADLQNFVALHEEKVVVPHAQLFPRLTHFSKQTPELD